MFPTTDHHPDVREDNVQAPLGPEPSYDDVLDVAVQYTFPASDPIAVQETVNHKPERDEGAPKGPGMTPGRGTAVDPAPNAGFPHATD